MTECVVGIHEISVTNRTGPLGAKLTVDDLISGKDLRGQQVTFNGSCLDYPSREMMSTVTTLPGRQACAGIRSGADDPTPEGI